MCTRKINGQIINATSKDAVNPIALVVMSLFAAVGSMIRRRQEDAMVMEASAA